MSANRPPRPEVLAFLQDIKQNPDDDTPRLILADWLEEHDDPRGEFLRLQCAAAALFAKDGRVKAIQQREQELLSLHQEEWLTPLALKSSRTDPQKLHATFRRGLIHVQIPIYLFLAQSWAKPENWQGIEQTEWIECLTFWNNSTEQVFQLVSAPICHRLTSIHLQRGHARPQSVADVLADAAHLANLVALAITDWAIDDASLVRLAESPHLTNLKKLHLVDNSLRGTGLYHLSRWAQLQSLDLSRNQLGDDGTMPLRKVAFPRLTHLALDFNRMGDRGAGALAACSSLTNLRSLTLAGNLIGSEGTAALAASSSLAQLRTLNLSANRIGAKGAAALAMSPHLQQLTLLDLQGNSIPPAKTAVLEQRFGKALRL